MDSISDPRGFLVPNYFRFVFNFCRVLGEYTDWLELTGCPLTPPQAELHTRSPQRGSLQCTGKDVFKPGADGGLDFSSASLEGCRGVLNLGGLGMGDKGSGQLQFLRHVALMLPLCTAKWHTQGPLRAASRCVLNVGAVGMVDTGLAVHCPLRTHLLLRAYRTVCSVQYVPYACAGG